MGIKLNDEKSTARATFEAINIMQKNKELQPNGFWWNENPPINRDNTPPIRPNQRTPMITPGQASTGSQSGDSSSGPSNRLRDNNNAYKQYPRWRRILG